ncbi:hypothetical protein M8C21_001468 [Ambrosia artemisiifolia]|uniref:Uncharacterized protein n=1 Tax=Ambrosia artemisiifolia TaxID=4212 RepID=A0AAD5GZV5_AMBAR|nr:hypothetical protein M8C21_001468 [Ambrosia artemisiifolia]
MLLFVLICFTQPGGNDDSYQVGATERRNPAYRPDMHGKSRPPYDLNDNNSHGNQISSAPKAPTSFSMGGTFKVKPDDDGVDRKASSSGWMRSLHRISSAK